MPSQRMNAKEAARQAHKRGTPETPFSYWQWVALGAIIVLATSLRFGNLAAIGDANPYFTAGVASMLHSWSNFFFVAAEPGGSVSLDKPPLGFWIQALFAQILGVNGVVVALPQLLAGVGSVLLVWHLVRRSFGMPAGLVAALVLAVTPVSIAVERTNKLDGLLVFVLLLATWAFVVATETGRRRILLGAAVVVGVAFNIKMLQAFIPLPAWYALYLSGAPHRWTRKIADLLLATSILIPITLAWAIVVDLTPADQRPYVGGSGNNTVRSLILDYNGAQRLTGLPVDRGGASLRTGVPQGGVGMFGSGTPGPLRVWQVGLAAQLSWVLPWGLLMVGGALMRAQWRNRADPLAHAVVLWGGWLLTGLVLLSHAPFMHPYYLALLGPPLAALVGVGVPLIWKVLQRHRTVTVVGLVAGVAITLGWQLIAVGLYLPPERWILVPAVLAGVGLGLLCWSAWVRTGLAVVVAALLVLPTLWSYWTMVDPAPSGIMPQAYPGAPPALRDPYRLHAAEATALTQYLAARTADTRYLAVVPNALVGAPLVLAAQRPVLYAGGFNGADPVLTDTDLAALVTSGNVRYVLWSVGGTPRATTPGLVRYLQTQCRVVGDGPLASATARLAPAPSASPQPRVDLQLYQCQP